MNLFFKNFPEPDLLEAAIIILLAGLILLPVVVLNN